MIYLIEGPDGSGKTTLAQQLITERNATVLPRNCTSRGGPFTERMADYFQWTSMALPRLAELEELYILDRHPVVSELIYGPLLRGTASLGDNPAAFYKAFATLRFHTTLILCMPPKASVMANVLASDDQMDGVVESTEKLYQAYHEFWKAQLFPTMIRYDYTTMGEILL